MLNLNLLNEAFSNNFSYHVFTILFLTSIFCGILIITSKNPVVSVLFLIGLFLSRASYLMMTAINFIGLSYLLVYVGAVLILFLLILMLINIRISELLRDNNNSIPFAIIITVILSLMLYKLLPYNYNVKTTVGTGSSIYDYKAINISEVSDIVFVDNKLLLVTYQTWDGILAEMSQITTMGSIIYTVYTIWLILKSLILSLAMVGAITITLK